MEEVNYIQGPWKAHATGKARSGKPEYEIHWSEFGECIAEIVHGKGEANLIAAAPDLLEALTSDALNKLMGMIEDSADEEMWRLALLWMDRRDAAIRKAKGEE